MAINRSKSPGFMGPALFKSRFCAIEDGREHPCLSPDAGGSSLGANPSEKAGKIAGFEYSLDFWSFLSRKRTMETDA
jgi:hypothetical protein